MVWYKYEETDKLCPKTAISFFIPIKMNESSCCSTSLPTFNVVSVLDFGHSLGAWWYLTVKFAFPY